jgi:hypothetical protein
MRREEYEPEAVSSTSCGRCQAASSCHQAARVRSRTVAALHAKAQAAAYDYQSGGPPSAAMLHAALSYLILSESQLSMNRPT